MTTLLSTVVVFLAAVVLTAVIPTTARAADSCLAKPTGNPPNGSHWYYQMNRGTHQKCWVLGATKATVRNIALQRSPNLRNSNELAERTTAVSCIKAPNGQAPQGKHWYYRTDKATGQRCWHLGTRVSKIGNAVPARSPEPVKLVAPEPPAVVLPQAAADAMAKLGDKTRLLDAFIASLRRIETAASPGSGIAEVADENLVTPKFESRWINLSDSARSNDRQPNPAGDSEMHQPVPAAAFDDVTNSTQASGRLFTAEWPRDDTLIAFLVSLGGALVLFGLIGRSFLYLRSAPPVRPNPPPRLLPSSKIPPNFIRANGQRVLEVAGERDRY